MYLVFYNAVRVISNVKIEYDFWRSDTGRHIWGVNSSATVYYKYRSSWQYGVFKCNLFYIEFSFALFKIFVVKPLKRFFTLISFRRSFIDDIYVSSSFWKMINISLVQIIVGPLGINGLSFSLFNPIFWIMSFCFLTCLGWRNINGSVNSQSLNSLKYFNIYQTSYYKTITFDLEEPKKMVNEEENKIVKDLNSKKYNIKKLLNKFSFVALGDLEFIRAFISYLDKENILFNIMRSWKICFILEDWFLFPKAIFHAFVKCLKSVPDYFEYMFPPSDTLSPEDKKPITAHEMRIWRDYYVSNERPYYALYDKDFYFCGLCDIFFLSLSLLLFSMIDSISIDLRWFIDNETVVRKYCTKIKRKVCRFFQK